MLVSILSPFLGQILYILTHILLLFGIFCTMQLTIQASGMNKFKIYVNYFYYHHFTVSMVKIDIICSAFDVLIHVYNYLQVIWSFRQANKQTRVQLDIWRAYLARRPNH